MTDKPIEMDEKTNRRRQTFTRVNKNRITPKNTAKKRLKQNKTKQNRQKRHSQGKERDRQSDREFPLGINLKKIIDVVFI